MNSRVGNLCYVWGWDWDLSVKNKCAKFNSPFYAMSFLSILLNLLFIPKIQYNLYYNILNALNIQLQRISPLVLYLYKQPMQTVEEIRSPQLPSANFIGIN